jgi:agmatinase
MNFADAQSTYREADFVVVGVPFEDEEMSFRGGAAQAPDFIRFAAWNFESYDLRTGIDLQSLNVHDAGDKSLPEASDFVGRAVAEGKVPLVMGGAHSITPPLVAAITDDIGVVILDAHMDFRKEYVGKAASHACTARRIFEARGKDRIASIGIRSASKEEVADANDLDFTYYLSNEFNRAIADSLPFENLYLSVDMDVFDPSIAPGVSNPEPYGMGYELFDFMRRLAHRIVAMDVVELCPAYDNGTTAGLAAKMLRDLMAERAARG